MWLGASENRCRVTGKNIIKRPIDIGIKYLHLLNISINSPEKPGFQLQKRLAARVLMAELMKLQNFIGQKLN